MTDHYETLEIDRNATQEDIKIAYRKLAKRYHPDKIAQVPDASEAFKIEMQDKMSNVSNAYSTLSDPEKRKYYDQTGLDDKPKGIEEMAHDRIVELFDEIISSAFNEEELFNIANDSVESVLKHLEQQKSHSEREIERIDERIDFIKEVKKTRSKNGSRSHLMKSIDKTIHILTEKKKSINFTELLNQIALFKRVQEIIKEEYPREIIKPKDDWFNRFDFPSTEGMDQHTRTQFDDFFRRFETRR